MMKAIEQTLSSREVAEMVEKDHSKLIRDIRRYEVQFNEANIGSVEFFQESTYTDSKGEVRPCYNVTIKGCEFIAHKLTGTKGTIFTAKYINRFHEMQDIISKQESQPDLPWFIRKFKGDYIVLQRDFITITGVDINKHKLFFRPEYFEGGLDWNGHGWKCNKEDFKNKYGFDFGEDDCMMFLYPCGVIKSLNILLDDKKVHMNPGAYEMLTDGINAIEALNPKRLITNNKQLEIIGTSDKNVPMQINIYFHKKVM